MGRAKKINPYSESVGMAVGDTGGGKKNVFSTGPQIRVSPTAMTNGSNASMLMYLNSKNTRRVLGFIRGVKEKERLGAGCLFYEFFLIFNFLPLA